VRACLAAVESGNVDAGIVYKNRRADLEEGEGGYEITVSEGPKISYPLAVVKESKNVEGAQKFVAYLASTEARAVFTKYGFLPAP